jgi:hypothetical protein
MDQLKWVDEAKVQPVSKRLRQLEQLLSGLNYEVTLEVKALELPGAELHLSEVMRKCYPRSEPQAAKVTGVSAGELKTEVDACLTYEGDEHAGPRFTPARRTKLEQELLPAFWRELAELIAYEEAELHSYGNETGLPGYPVFWFFAFALHDRSQRRCVVITGSSSD